MLEGRNVTARFRCRPSLIGQKWAGFIYRSVNPASTSSYRFKVLQEYDYGILKRVKRSDAGQTIYREAQTQDAFGNVIDEDFGNGSTSIRGFDGVTGRVDYIQTSKSSTVLQDLSYSWDKVGNLSQRKDWRQSGNPTEDFAYDSLNRLTDADITGAATSSLNVTFGENGNIESKDDVSGSNWVYHSTNKHAVVTAGPNAYGYDANGNMTSRKGDTLSWTSYNYPSKIIDGSRTYDYSYDASRQKWKQVYKVGSATETTYFAGRIFEKNINSSDTEHRHHIMANGKAVALFIERTSGSDYLRYMTHDHLGSVDGIIQNNGTTTYVRESFSAYGERRDSSDWVGDPSAGDLTKIATTTDRGYTDHIGLEQSSLVHMNGRVYDAEIGRFLSPDPYVTAYHTQGYNRYAYVVNNPMRYTDPTGYCAEPLSGFICRFVFASALNFLFGGGDDDPPPPDWCKDNTAGCGAVAINMMENISLDIFALPLDGESEDDESSETESDDEHWDAKQLLRDWFIRVRGREIAIEMCEAELECTEEDLERRIRELIDFRNRPSEQSQTTEERVADTALEILGVDPGRRTLESMFIKQCKICSGTPENPFWEDGRRAARRELELGPSVGPDSQ